MGHIALGSCGIGHIRLAAPADADLLLESVRSPCPCLRVLDYPERVLAGTPERLHVAIFPYKEGAFSQIVWVKATSNRPLAFVLKGTAFMPAKLEPNPLSRIDPGLLRIRRLALPPDLFIDARELIAERASKNDLLLDVRTQEEGLNLSVPGSRRIALSELKKQSFLNGRSVVLIGAGGGSPEMLAACLRLRKEGRVREARILHGGLAAWIRAGGETLASSASPQTAPDRLTPAQYFQGRGIGAWTLLNADQSPTVSCGILFPGSEMVGTSTEACAKSLQALAAESARPVAFRKVLFFNRDGIYPESLLRLAETAPVGVAVFYLKGGWQSYLDYLRSGSAQVATRKKRPDNGCSVCP
jgi:rhodanese-related sulfurtransferase